MASFTPIDPKEFNQELAVGEASFRVSNVVDTDKIGFPLKTKNGDPMVRIDLLVTDCEAHTEMMFLWLPLMPKMMWKIHDFCLAIGHPEFYEQGTLTRENLVDCFGNCVLRKKFDDYRGREVVEIGNFIERKRGAGDFGKDVMQAASKAGVSPILDDEIPF